MSTCELRSRWHGLQNHQVKFHMMKYERNVAMKVFSQLYVGYKHQILSSEGYDYKTHEYKNPVYGVPLGFATPYEDNAAGRKRQSTVDNWATPYSHDKTPKLEAKIIDNELLEGFKITDDIKRVYWGGGNVVFRVEDPRGFELEIQSQNLMTLIKLVGLNAGGVIPGKCLWGRDGPNNILLHESSQEYQTARMAAETIKPLKGAAKDTFKPGDIVILTNGQEVRYLGRFWFTKYEHDEAHEDVQFTSEKTKLRRFDTTSNACVLRAPVQYHAVTAGGAQVTIYRDIKVAEVKEPAATAWSAEASLNLINKAEISTASSTTGAFVGAATTNTQMVWKKRPLTEAEFKKLLRTAKEKHSGVTGFSVYMGYKQRLPYFFSVNDQNGDAWYFAGDRGFGGMGRILDGMSGRDLFCGDLLQAKGEKLIITYVRDHGHWHISRYEPAPHHNQKVLPVYEKMSKESALAQLEAMYNNNLLYTFEPIHQEPAQ